MPTTRKKTPAKKTVAKKQKGLAQTFGGLSKKRLAKKGSGTFGVQLILKKGETEPVQFLGTPNTDAFLEYDQHVFQADGMWQFVPCSGSKCELCEDENPKISAKGYAFVTNVYDHKQKKVLILGGPRDLAQRIAYRYERAPSRFLKRVYEVTKFDTTPVSYEFQIGEDPPIRTDKLKSHDLNAFLDEQIKRFLGESTDTKGKDLEDEDEEEIDEDELEEDEDLEEEDEDFDDDEDEDEDLDDEDEDEDDLDDDDLDDEEEEEEDEEEDEEDEEPAPRKSRKAPVKKAPARRTPTKTATKKAPAKTTAKKKTATTTRRPTRTRR